MLNFPKNPQPISRIKLIVCVYVYILYKKKIIEIIFKNISTTSLNLRIKRPEGERMRWIEMCERDGETELSWRLNNNWLTVIYTSSWHCSIAALCIYTYILYIDHSAIQCSLRLNMCSMGGGGRRWRQRETGILLAHRRLLSGIENAPQASCKEKKKVAGKGVRLKHNNLLISYATRKGERERDERSGPEREREREGGEGGG